MIILNNILIKSLNSFIIFYLILFSYLISISIKIMLLSSSLFIQFHMIIIYKMDLNLPYYITMMLINSYAFILIILLLVFFLLLIFLLSTFFNIKSDKHYEIKYKVYVFFIHLNLSNLIINSFVVIMFSELDRFLTLFTLIIIFNLHF